MIKSNFGRQRKIPKITTRKSAPMTTNFAKGIYTYKPNDVMGLDELRLAQDARFDRVGEYGTRYGLKKLIQPVGYAFAAGSSSFISLYTAIKDVTPYEFEAQSTMNVCSIKIKAKRSSSATENHTVARAKLYVNNVLKETLYFNVESTTATELEAYLKEPLEILQNSTVKVIFDAFRGSDTSIMLSNTLVPNVQFYSCRIGQVTNVFEANIDGDHIILFTFTTPETIPSTALYWVGSSDSFPTIKRYLPNGVTKVRFSQNLNQIRYADGKEAPHLLTPTITNGKVTDLTDSAIEVKDLQTGTAMTVNVSNVMHGTSDNLIYFASDPDTEAIWTYPYGYTYAKSPSYTTTATISGAVGTTLTVQLSSISPSGIAVGDWITGQGTATAEVTAISGNNVSLRIVDTTPQTISSYDKFSVDFYQNFPAIKTGDPLTAMFNLGGVLYMMTRRNKYQMFMQTAESWSQNASNAQNGTFSQESVVCDLNYAYFANENGIYIFDGSSEASLTENTIQNVYDAIIDKDKIVLDLYKNRLYVFYPSQAGGENDSCLVYNINLKVWESFDSNTFVSATSARQNSSSRFICGHSKMGMLMLNESAQDNDYSDMGRPIAFNIETAYQHYGSTSQLKRITKWRPEFASTTKPYTCECGYALDFTDQVEYAFSIDLQRNEVVNTNYIWDNPSDYGAPAIPTIHTTLPLVNGEFYRIQIRYQHIAAFEPVIFRSHTLTVQTQRIR